MDIGAIVLWFQNNWVAICAALWALEQFLRIIAPLTPWKWDDNLVGMVGKIFDKYLPKPTA